MILGYFLQMIRNCSPSPNCTHNHYIYLYDGSDCFTLCYDLSISHRYIGICALCGVYVKNTCWMNTLILKYLKIGEAWRERERKLEEKGRTLLATPLSLPSVRLIIPPMSLESSSYLQRKVQCAGDQTCVPFSGKGGLPWCFPLYKLMIVFKSQQVNSPGCRYFSIPGDARKYQVPTSVCCPLLAKAWFCTPSLRMGTRLKLRYWWPVKVELSSHLALKSQLELKGT